MARRDQARFSFGRARRARHRPDRRGQPHQVQPLALERFAGTRQPCLRLTLRIALERDLDEAGIATVEVAQQVHRVGEIAARMGPGQFEQGGQIGMARTALARDAGQLCFGNADRFGPRQSINLTRTLVVDGPIDRHSSPLVIELKAGAYWARS